MNERTLFTMDTPYRQPFEVRGFEFGAGMEACAIVGAMRGNEVQQMYVCARLVRELRHLEERGYFVSGRKVLVIPCVNNYSMNVGSRFWSLDDTDINRMFPGYDRGETTQRIAAAVFEAVKDYKFGIHFPSFYLPGDFVSHVRIMETGFEKAGGASGFGLPFTIVRKPAPIDTTTLNYNWQIWNAKAYSIYTEETDNINEENARELVAAVLRFLGAEGIIRRHPVGGYRTTVLEESELVTVLTERGGIFRRIKNPGDEVHKSQLIGEIMDPYTAKVISELRSPVDGLVFFGIRKPLVTEHEIAFRLINIVE